MRERRKFAAMVAGVGLAAIAVVGGALLRLKESGAENDQAVAVIVFALAGLAAALALIWARVDLKLFRPVQQLQRDLDTILHAEPGRAVDLPVPGVLEDLVERIDALISRDDIARREMAHTIASATDRLQDVQDRLAAILRDLSEGVVVSSIDHRILLFNDAARRTLPRGEALGVGRRTEEFIEKETLDQLFVRIGQNDQGDSGPVEATLPSIGVIRMATVTDPSRELEGYVFTFPGKAPDAKERAGKSALPPRPVFYDFDLPRQHRSHDGRGSAALSDLEFVVFDTETTGLRPHSGDEIVQLGAVRVLRGRVNENETFETLVNPGRTIPASSIRFHGITDEMVVGAPMAGEAIRRFHDFTGDGVLVAQNAAFDMRFLKLKEKSVGLTFDGDVLDTMLLSFYLHPEQGDHTLDGIAARYGVDISGRHTALGDALVTARVFAAMIPLLASAGIVTLNDAYQAMLNVADKFRSNAGR
jgi:DNA polymerase-3 subunit epsilon